MDQETVLQQFEVLEKKIESLIEISKNRESEIETLKQENEQLVAELQEKEATEQQNEQLRSLVRNKLDSLMGRLSEFAEE